MSELETQKDPRSNGFLRFIRTVIRILITIILAVGLGAGAYYSVIYVLPRLQDRFLQPIEENTSRLESLEGKFENQLSIIQERWDSLAQRIQTLEIKYDDQQSNQGMIQSTLEQLASENQAAQATLQSFQTENQLLNSQVDNLQTQAAANQDHLSYLATQQVPVELIRAEAKMLLVMDLLSRSKQSLLHENYGLSAQDLQEAQTLLTDLLPKLPSFQQEVVRRILESNKTALEALPDSPRLAAGALDLSWQLAAQGLPGQSPPTTPQATPTPDRTPSSTSSPD